MAVLDVNNAPIQLDPTTQVRIDDDGSVVQNGSTVAQLRLVDAPSDALSKVGDNALRLNDEADAAAATVRVRQGFIEESAVDAISTLNGMMSASKAANANMKMMQYHDFALGQVFNTYARVS